MGDDHAERVGALHLLAVAEEEMLDAVARIVARHLPLHALVGVERHIDGAVAEAVDCGLQPVFGRVDHQLVHLFLLVVGHADILKRAVGVAPGHGEAGVDGVHEEFDDAAAQAVGDIVREECAARGRFRRGEKAVAAAHLVDHDRQFAALVGDSVDFGAFGHHHGVAHAGDAVREVPAGVLVDQAGHDVGSQSVDVGAHRGLVDGVHGAFPEHPGRLAFGIPQDFAAARIRRLPRDPAQRHRGRVGVAGVVGGIHHADGVVGRGLVQLAALQRGAELAPAGAVAQPPNPLAVGRTGCGGSDRFEHSGLAGQGRHAAINRAGLEGGHREVVVGVAEAGDQRASAQLDVDRFRADGAAHLAAVADGDDSAVAHGDAGGDAVQRVHREHAAAGEEQFHCPPPALPAARVARPRSVAAQG